MNDPVLETLAKFNDLSQWEDVKYNVPIFVEHELWEVPHPFTKGETTKVAILPGQPKPSVGKMLYAINTEDLTKVAQRINKRLNESGNAVKLFIGHTSNQLPQTHQPPLVGYGVGASVGPSGPKGRLAVLLQRVLHTKGSAHRDYPERSPEFDPLRGEITGLALLKTDPKLPMGLVTYASTIAGYQAELKGIVCYGQDKGVIRYQDMAEKPEEKPGKGAEGKPDYKPLESPKQSDTGPDPTAPPNPVELEGPEREMADRFMKYYEGAHPVMRYMCTKYASDMQQANEPTGTEEIPGPGDPGEPPAEPAGEDPSAKFGKPEAKPDKPEVKMASDVSTIQYAQLQADLEGMKKAQADMDAKLAAFQAANQGLQTKYASEHATRLLTGVIAEGYLIKNPAKELEKMSAMDDAGRTEHVNYMRDNFAKNPDHQRGGPTGPMIGIFDEPLPGTPITADKAKEASKEEVDQVVRYAADNKIDINKNGEWEKALEAIRKAG